MNCNCAATRRRNQLNLCNLKQKMKLNYFLWFVGKLTENSIAQWACLYTHTQHNKRSDIVLKGFAHHNEWKQNPLQWGRISLAVLQHHRYLTKRKHRQELTILASNLKTLSWEPSQPVTKIRELEKYMLHEKLCIYEIQF